MRLKVLSRGTRIGLIVIGWATSLIALSTLAAVSVSASLEIRNGVCTVDGTEEPADWVFGLLPLTQTCAGRPDYPGEGGWAAAVIFWVAVGVAIVAAIALLATPVDTAASTGTRAAAAGCVGGVAGGLGACGLVVAVMILSGGYGTLATPSPVPFAAGSAMGILIAPVSGVVAAVGTVALGRRSMRMDAS